MNTSHGPTQTPQVAVWYFIGATFAFAALALFFQHADLWVRIAFFAAGLIAIVGGGIQLGREINQRRSSRADPRHDGTSTERDTPVQ